VVAVSAYHSSLGTTEVIEDYVHSAGIKLLVSIVAQFVARAGRRRGHFAILRVGSDLRSNERIQIDDHTYDVVVVGAGRARDCAPRSSGRSGALHRCLTKCSPPAVIQSGAGRISAASQHGAEIAWHMYDT